MPRTVLDLGAYDGRASAGLVRPGDRWVLVDNKEYLRYDNWPIPILPEGIVYKISDIMDYKEPAEVVVCSNVLYHAPDPHAFLKHLRELTIDTLFLKTYYDTDGEGWHYYGEKIPAHPHKETADTIFYRPTVNALVEEVLDLGFNVHKVILEYHSWPIPDTGLIYLICTARKES